MTETSQITSELIASIALFKPETTLVATFLLAMVSDIIFRKQKYLAGYIAAAGLAVTGFFVLQQTGFSHKAFSGLLVIDPFGQFLKFVILLTGLAIIVFTFFSDELNKSHPGLGEYFTLITGMTFGMFLLVASANLIMIYIAIEIMSISSYVLAGYTKEVKRASEASLKYVIFGAVFSGIMIYGISILFGLTGSLNLSDISLYLSSNNINTLPLLVSVLMILSGFGYKISAVPFHFWTPDVYEGAPITITAYLSVASKAAGFAVLLRFFRSGLVLFTGTNEIWQLAGGIDWHSVLAILSILTMTAGNLAALSQKNLKRLLAYSGIAHAGYLLMAVTVMNDTGVAAVLIYFFYYMIMNLGAFFIVQLVADRLGSENIDDYNGLGYRSALTGICLTVFLVSLAGLPPTGGFIGKLYVFTTVIQAGYYWLALAGIINSVISLYYYARIIRNMYIRDHDFNDSKIPVSPAAAFVLLIFAVPTVVMGIFFSPVVNWANFAMSIFSGN